jgi:TrmH family RNA methyltransferase
MKTITSRQNPLFKRIRAAIREHEEEIVIEGPKAVADAIAHGWKPIAVVKRDDGVGSWQLAVGSGDTGHRQPPTANRQLFSSELFDALSETRAPQDVIGLFERPRGEAAAILGRRDSIAVALDGVQDPGNVGTIVRLAAAFDAAGVLLLPGCADAFGPKAVRASAGAILSVPVAEVTLQELIASNVPLIATAADGERVDPPSRDAVLVFGSEGSGVSDEIARAARKLAIATSGRVESLNVGASAAILLARSYALR